MNSESDSPRSAHIRIWRPVLGEECEELQPLDIRRITNSRRSQVLKSAGASSGSLELRFCRRVPPEFLTQLGRISEK